MIPKEKVSPLMNEMEKLIFSLSWIVHQNIDRSNRNETSFETHLYMMEASLKHMREELEK